MGRDLEDKDSNLLVEVSKEALGKGRNLGTFSRGERGLSRL
jgi:hypothetical protein